MKAFGGRIRKDQYKHINSRLAKLGILYDYKEREYFQWLDQNGEKASFDTIPTKMDGYRKEIR